MCQVQTVHTCYNLKKIINITCLKDAEGRYQPIEGRRRGSNLIADIQEGYVYRIRRYFNVIKRIFNNKLLNNNNKLLKIRVNNIIDAATKKNAPAD